MFCKQALYPSPDKFTKQCLQDAVSETQKSVMSTEARAGNEMIAHLLLMQLMASGAVNALWIMGVSQHVQINVMEPRFFRDWHLENWVQTLTERYDLCSVPVLNPAGINSDQSNYKAENICCVTLNCHISLRLNESCEMLQFHSWMHFCFSYHKHLQTRLRHHFAVAIWGSINY